MNSPAPSVSQPSTLNSQPAVAPASRSRRGKVARLPKALRDQLNVMLLDGVPYADILQLVATSAAELVRHLDYVDFKQLLRDDPAKLIPFLNALARISDAEMRCERHRLEMERLKTGLNPTAAAEKAPGLSPETRQRLEQELNLMYPTRPATAIYTYRHLTTFQNYAPPTRP